MEKGLYSFGPLVMVDGILILVIVTDTQTVFSHCQYPALHKEVTNPGTLKNVHLRWRPLIALELRDTIKV